MANVLIACEFSGTVRDAFLSAGHYAMSCDLRPCESPRWGPHYQGSALDVLSWGWDLMIAHPPCTYLACSNGNFNWREPSARAIKRGDSDRFIEMFAAVRFFEALYNAPIPRICVENPQALNILHTRVGRPSQVIHPWMFGDREEKRTCLWMKNLPLLTSTNNVKEETMRLPKEVRQWRRYLPASKDRGKKRSVFFKGAAEAMAQQWGDLPILDGTPTRNVQHGLRVEGIRDTSQLDLALHVEQKSLGGTCQT